MKRKLLIATIVLSIVLLFSGCLSSDTPRDTPIILNKDNATFNVVVRSDYSKVTWTLDDKSREDNIPDDNNTASYLLEYKNIPVGNHTLKVEDEDDVLKWQVEVQGTKEEQNQYGQNNSESKNSGYPTWEEQIKNAEKKKANK